MKDFLLPRLKAIGGFVTAEAGTFLLLLQSGADLSLRNVLVAALTPVAVGAAVHTVPNVAG